MNKIQIDWQTWDKVSFTTSKTEKNEHISPIRLSDNYICTSDTLKQFIYLDKHSFYGKSNKVRKYSLLRVKDKFIKHRHCISMHMHNAS